MDHLVCYSDKSHHRLHYLNMLNVSQLMRAGAKHHFIDYCVNYDSEQLLKTYYLQNILLFKKVVSCEAISLRPNIIKIT